MWCHAGREQALGLRREQETAWCHRPVERLDAEAVAGEDQFAGAAVPIRKAEHAVEPANAIRAIAAQQRQYNFGVGAGTERVAPRGQLSAQLPEVVRLAVVDE